MHRLDAALILELSERGAVLAATRRALLVLAAAFPEVGQESWLALPLGARDRLLLRIRASLFGDEIVARQSCHVCAEGFELSFTAQQLGFPPEGEAEDFPPPARGVLTQGRKRYDVRAVTVADMLAAETAGGVEEARAQLVARTVPDAPAGALDPARVTEALETLDPLADIVVEAACPHCGASGDLPFNVAEFVWKEVAARAPRILRDVAALARAYHWSERDILAMPPSRRAFYLAAAAV